MRNFILGFIAACTLSATLSWGQSAVLQPGPTTTVQPALREYSGGPVGTGVGVLTVTGAQGVVVGPSQPLQADENGILKVGKSPRGKAIAILTDEAGHVICATGEMQ